MNKTEVLSQIKKKTRRSRVWPFLARFGYLLVDSRVRVRVGLSPPLSWVPGWRLPYTYISTRASAHDEAINRSCRRSFVGYLTFVTAGSSSVS